MQNENSTDVNDNPSDATREPQRVSNVNVLQTRLT